MGAMTSKLVVSTSGSADIPVYPAKTLYIALTKTRPRGAKTKNPDEAVLKGFVFVFDAVMCSSRPAECMEPWRDVVRGLLGAVLKHLRRAGAQAYIGIRRPRTGQGVERV